MGRAGYVGVSTAMTVGTATAGGGGSAGARMIQGSAAGDSTTGGYMVLDGSAVGTMQYDDGNAFSAGGHGLADGQFITPTTGRYHIDATIYGNAPNIDLGDMFNLDLFVNSTPADAASTYEAEQRGHYIRTLAAPFATGFAALSASCDCQLTAGDLVWLAVTYTAYPAAGHPNFGIGIWVVSFNIHAI